jgi:hypothetical protein
MSTNNQIRTLAKVIRKMPTKRYQDYMRSPNWKYTRREHFERVGYICEICRTARACQCHHWTYARLGFELPQDLCAVCVTCHHRIHCSIYEPANDNQLQLPLDVRQPTPRKAAAQGP